MEVEDEDDWVAAGALSALQARAEDVDEDDWVGASAVARADQPVASAALPAVPDDDEDDWVGAAKVPDAVAAARQPPMPPPPYRDLLASVPMGPAPKRMRRGETPHPLSPLGLLCEHLLSDRKGAQARLRRCCIPANCLPLAATSPRPLFLFLQCTCALRPMRVSIACAASSPFSRPRRYAATGPEATRTRCNCVRFMQKYDGTKTRVSAETPAAGINDTALCVRGASGSADPPVGELGCIELLKGEQEVQGHEHSRMPVDGYILRGVAGGRG
jgi:hypothetical protein